MQNFLEQIRRIAQEQVPVNFDKALDEQLKRGFVKYDAYGNCVARYCFQGDEEQLYRSVVKRLEQKESAVPEMQFSGGNDDLAILRQSILTVFEQEKLVAETVHGLNVSIGTDDGNGKNLPSYLSFCSAYLYDRFPNSFIPFNFKIYGKSKLLFHAAPCSFNGCIVTEAVKQTLFTDYQKTRDNLNVELVETTVKTIYIDFCTKVYAFCCFLKERFGNVNHSIALATAVFDGIKEA